MKLIYVAGPFRSVGYNGQQNCWGIQVNVMHAMALALEVWRRGHAALCPHANTMFYQNAAADEVWLEGDLEMLRRCDAILLTDNWERSSGARAEAEFAKSIGLPVLYDTNDLDAFLATPPTQERHGDQAI